MLTPTTALPQRNISTLRQWLKSLERHFKDWQLRRLHRTEATALVRAAEQVDIGALVARLPARPTLPLICIVDDFDPQKLASCLRSLGGQHYPEWRIHLVAEERQRAPLDRLLARFRETAERIRVQYLAGDDWSPWTAIRLALAECQETHVGFVGCRDQLTEDALLWIATTLGKHPLADWIYADEATLEDDGRVGDFHYKPDFSWFYLLARFFTGTFGVYRRELLWRVLPELSNDPYAWSYDLALRLAEDKAAQQIVHVPQILSLVSRLDDQGPREERRAVGEQRVVEAAFQRRGIPAQVAPHPRHALLRQFRLQPRAWPRVSIVIPNRNSSSMLRSCLESLRAATRYPHYEIVVIDHASDEPALLDYLASETAQRRLRVVPYEGRFNFSDMNNRAIETTDGELVLALNNDIDGFCDGWLEQLVATIQLDERIGVVGALLYYPDGTIQHGGICFGLGKTGRHSHIDLPQDALGYQGRLRTLQEVSAVTGAMMLLRRSAFERIGGFDPKYPDDFNDTDLCLRMRAAGYRCVYTPHVTAFHYSSKTRRKRFTNREAMLAQWGHLLGRDPFYSPHLSRQRFELGELNYLWDVRKKVDLAERSLANGLRRR